MAVRVSMTQLISQVRSLIGDVDIPQQFNDQVIQDVLDLNRDKFLGLALKTDTSLLTGLADNTAWYSDYANWEADTVLKDLADVALTPSNPAPQLGMWEFATAQTNGVYAYGNTYDVFAAAADLLDQWASAESGVVDFSADGMSVKRSTAGQGRRITANYLRSRSRKGGGAIKSMKLVRNDINA